MKKQILIKTKSKKYKIIIENGSINILYFLLLVFINIFFFMKVSEFFYKILTGINR